MQQMQEQLLQNYNNLNSTLQERVREGVRQQLALLL